MMIPEQRLTRAMVDLADTLSDDFDVIDHLRTLTRRAVEFIDADAAGLMMASRNDQPQLTAHTDKRAQALDRVELQTHQGPGLQCLNTGRPVANLGPEEIEARWPLFGRALAASQFRSEHAVPLQRHGEILGAMTLLCRNRPALSGEQLAVGQALAAAATIGLLQRSAVRQREVLAGHLQSALDSRIAIEQAKGILAAQSDVDVETAFVPMRDYARRNAQKIHLVAQAVIDGDLTATTLTPSQD